MASELPGARGVQLGRLNAVTNFGQIVGTTLCGFLLAAVGFQLIRRHGRTGAIAFAAGLGTPGAAAQAPPGAPCARRVSAAAARAHHRLHGDVRLPVRAAVLAHHVVLSGAARDYGHSEEASGILLALRALGSIGASLLVARFVRTGPQTLWPVVCGVAVAASVGLLPTVNHVLPIAFWMLVVGAGTAAMTLYFQVTISEASRPRSAARRWPGRARLERLAPEHAAHHGLPRRSLRPRHRLLRTGRIRLGLRPGDRLPTPLGVQATLNTPGSGRALQQAVELGAVAAGKARGLADVAAGDLQDAHQVLALERLARLVERRELAFLAVQRLPDERVGMMAVADSATACSTTFSSWRTLPGHGADTSSSRASGDKVRPLRW